ncbi:MULTISPECIES: hypothetical protein [Paraburkholderia]|uniref:hypothetical protein n=1 Tax=Paraburkholderia TaxID=1822464 RepID=UPI00159110B2|nr:hypothetical protein [Paraburkholderia tropica]
MTTLRRPGPPIPPISSHAASARRGAVRSPVAFAARTTTLLALCAALAAWPSPTRAQDDAASGASASANGRHSDSDDTLTSAARRTRADAQRLLGSPTASHNPYSGGGAYSSDGSSPGAQEKALMSESRMRIVSPTDFYTTGSPAAGGSGGTRAGASSRARGASALNSASGSRSSTHSRLARAASPDAASSAQGGAWGAYDWGASTTSPSAKIYGNPYGSQRAAAAQLYRSPW